MQASNKYLILGFIIAFIAWLLFSDRKFSDRFLLYLFFFIGLYLSLSLYTGGGITLPSIAAAPGAGTWVSRLMRGPPRHL